MSTILYVGCDVPAGNAAAIRVFSNALSLQEYGYNVHILSFDHNFHKNIVETIQGITVHRVQYPANVKMWMKYLVEKQQYCKVINCLDGLKAVITYDQPAISFLRVRAYCKKKKIAYVCDCAEWHSNVHLNGIAKFVKSLDIALSMRYAYKKADGMIAISEYLRTYYKDFTKVVVIPPLQEKRQKKQEYSYPIKKIIYAGVPGKDKDRLDFIIESLSCIKESFEFNIFGVTEENFLNDYPELKNNIEKIRCNSNITFYGRVSHEMIIQQTCEAHFSFLIRNHSRKNDAGFPTKFAECICCGTPVIASDFSDVKKYIDYYGIGIMVNDLNDLTNSIIKALKLSEEKYSQMKSACYECNVFDYHSYTQVLGEFMMGLAKEK